VGAEARHGEEPRRSARTVAVERPERHAAPTRPAPVHLDDPLGEGPRPLVVGPAGTHADEGVAGGVSLELVEGGLEQVEPRRELPSIAAGSPPRPRAARPVPRRRSDRRRGAPLDPVDVSPVQHG
jgi:hypothetical protein